MTHFISDEPTVWDSNEDVQVSNFTNELSAGVFAVLEGKIRLAIDNFSAAVGMTVLASWLLLEAWLLSKAKAIAKLLIGHRNSVLSVMIKAE